QLLRFGGQQGGIGGQRDVLDPGHRGDHRHEVFEVAPQEGFAAGQPDLAHPQFGEHPDEPGDLFEAEQFSPVQELVVRPEHFPRHAVPAAEVAPVGHGNPQVAQPAAEPVRATALCRWHRVPPDCADVPNGALRSLLRASNRSYTSPASGGGNRYRGAGGEVVQRSISTWACCPVHYWVSVEDGWSAVSTLGLPCTHSTPPGWLASGSGSNQAPVGSTAMPGGTSGSMRAPARQAPRSLCTRTASPSRMPRVAASSGLIRTGSRPLTLFRWLSRPTSPWLCSRVAGWLAMSSSGQREGGGAIHTGCPGMSGNR